MSKLELTLSILKPHVVKNPLAAIAIQKLITDNQLKIVKQTRICMTKRLAETFYAEHREKFFYNRLQTLMCRLELKFKFSKENSNLTKNFKSVQWTH